MLRIDLLPAGRGDCLWIEYGSANTPRRVLIDGGLVSTCRKHIRPRLEALPKAKRRFELLVLTHIDLDHIAGILELLRDPPEGLEFEDVWFNGYKHLVEDPGAILGPLQGESVSALLEHHGYKWNHHFGGKAVAITDEGDLPCIPLHRGMTLTLLSPTRLRLAKLAPVWEEEVHKAHMEPGQAGWEIEGLLGHPEEQEEGDGGVLGDDQDIAELADSPFRDDRSEANGSSIAFLAEYEGKSVLCTGDAIASDMAAAVRRLLAERGGETLEVDAVKLSHHGGRKNTSPELLQLLRSPRFLFSTDGSMYRHPHRESVARVLVHAHRDDKPTILFNYRSDETGYWDDAGKYDGAYPYRPAYPLGAGTSVKL